MAFNLYSSKMRGARSFSSATDEKLSKSLKIDDTLKIPSVKVPVLSVNSMFILPAASMPVGFFTRTLSETIFLMFDERTTEIIKGSPSGVCRYN